MRLILSSLRFEDTALKELAESIRTEGVLSPLLVRPLTENGFEIVAGARRYRAAQMAEAATVPVRIVNLNDAEALEAQLIELSIVGKSFSLSLCDLGASFIWN
jgi:ParB/RepB/Spo0J family partition protein